MYHTFHLWCFSIVSILVGGLRVGPSPLAKAFFPPGGVTKLVYGLTNLTTSLLQSIKIFTIECRVKPKLNFTNFDNK